MLLSPELLQSLARSRLRVRVALPSGGIGDRRSKAKGAGIEFADHRPYHIGDDIRYLDRHVHARLGEHYIREFSMYEQLPITVLLDASSSMDFGAPSKFRFASQLTGALAYVGLVGNDRVQAAAFHGEEVHWYRTLHGVRTAKGLFSWLERCEPGGVTAFAMAARAVANRLSPGGLLVVVSDFMADDVESAFRIFGQLEQELVAVHVVAAEELDPSVLGDGDVTLVDVETGLEVDVSLSNETMDRYRVEIKAWRDRIRDLITKQNGRYLAAPTTSDLPRLLLNSWRTEGFIA